VKIIERKRSQQGWITVPWPVKRPWVVEGFALPDAGKTTLFKDMLPPLLGADGIRFRRFSQDEGSVRSLHEGLLTCLAAMRSSPMNRQRDIPEFHELASSVYLLMLKLNAIDITHSMVQEMCLWEHGPYFTWIIEHFWGKVSLDRLREEFSYIPKPDFGIFLEMTPRQLRDERRLQCSRMLLNYPIAQKIYEAMEEVARLENWPKVNARLSPDAVARIAHGEIRDRWTSFLETDQASPQSFEFPFEL
jgi:hypothetical protein